MLLLVARPGYGKTTWLRSHLTQGAVEDLHALNDAARTELLRGQGAPV